MPSHPSGPKEAADSWSMLGLPQVASALLPSGTPPEVAWGQGVTDPVCWRQGSAPRDTAAPGRPAPKGPQASTSEQPSPWPPGHPRPHPLVVGGHVFPLPTAACCFSQPHITQVAARAPAFSVGSCILLGVGALLATPIPTAGEGTLGLGCSSFHSVSCASPGFRRCQVEGQTS